MCHTIRVPLSPSTPLPSTTVTGVQPSIQAENDLERAIEAVNQAKRVIVVCGAGISVGAGIPDFRSTEGVFQTLKRDNPNLSSGKDLFSADVFKTAATTEMFNTMIGNLAEQATQSQPTAFHQLLKSLDDRGKLLRVYTQNIDCLEERAGLSYGIPAWNERRNRPSKGKGKVMPATTPDMGFLTPPTSHIGVSPSTSTSNDHSNSASPLSTPEPSASAPVAPRCIPLHGHVKTLYCPRCFHTTALEPYLEKISAGLSIPCSSCEELESTRRLVGKRERGVGQFRPSVVLYGEQHREGEVIGECVRRDLLGIQGPSWISNLEDSTRRKGKPKGPASSSKSKRKPDLLIVAGTSLKVPGTKSIVRQFSNAVRASSAPSPDGTSGEGSSSEGPEETSSVRTLFVNLDFPVPGREWNQGVFDYWLQGDVQAFAQLVQEGFTKQDEATKIKEEKKALAASRKLERELAGQSSVSPTRSITPSKKRKAPTSLPTTPVKKLKSSPLKRRLSITLPPAPSPSLKRAGTALRMNPKPEPVWMAPVSSSTLKARSSKGPISLLHSPPPIKHTLEVALPPRSPTVTSSSTVGSRSPTFSIEVPTYRSLGLSASTGRAGG